LTLVTLPLSTRCGHCDRPAAKHEHLSPSRSNPKGPIYFDCWTDEERAEYRAQGFPMPGE